MFMEYLLCVRACVRCWVMAVNNTDKRLRDIDVLDERDKPQTKPALKTACRWLQAYEIKTGQG